MKEIENSGTRCAQSQGGWTVPRIEIWINGLRRVVTFREFVDE